MANKTLSRSFAGGELAPELFGRADLDKFQTGLATCRNFITLPHGPVQNRPGFAYINEVKFSNKAVNLIEFSYSTDQTYILEFGNQYIRFHTNGGTLLEEAKVVTGIVGNTVSVTAHAFTIGKWVYIGSRYYIVATTPTANSFTVTNLDGTVGAPAGATASQVYEIASTYLEAHLFDIHYVQSADVLTLVHPSYPPRELKRLGATNWTLTSITFAPTIAAPTGLNVVATTGTGSTVYSYVVTAVASDGLEESIASAVDTITNNLTTAGNKNTLTWTAVTGALRYNVYKDRNGLLGYIGQTTAVSFIDDNIIADTTRTPPESINPFNAAGDYPGAVSYFDQRRCFGGTNNKPQNLWMTRSATESNMNYSIPTQDDDAISLRVVAREVNRIRHIVPLSEMILLTTNGEWKVTSQNSDALTPASVAARPQSFNGSGNVQPVVTGSSAVYVRSKSARVHDLSYSWENNAFKSSDLSLLCPHLFDDYTLTDMTITRTPVPVVWCTRSDGTLLGLTYMPDQKVWAWHQHDTEGTFKSVAAVSEEEIDVLYVVAERTINGRTVKYIERQADRRFATLADSFVVDAGSTYSGAAATVISGLWHLEGETVSILADGAVAPPQVVENGQVTLEQAASKVHIGLPITSDIVTLPLAMEMEALGQGRQKNLNKVFLRVYRSSGIKTGPSFDSLKPFKQRTTEPYGTPPNWVTGVVEVDVVPSWNSDGQLCVRQTDPLPLTVLSLTLEVALGG